MKPTVYIMSNKHRNVLYTGVTANLARRVYEHKSELIPGFTSRYSVTDLVYYESFEKMLDAISREIAIKKKSRRGKNRLIEAMNPHWVDLSVLPL